MERLEEKIKEYIESIEQLGADVRYWNDYKNYSKLRFQLESIEYWSKKAQKALDKIENKESE